MIKKILDQIANTSSKLEKESILRGHFNNELLKKVCFHTLNPFINYWIKKIPEYTSRNSSLDLNDAIEQLGVLSSRIKTGHEAIAHLKWIMEYCNPRDAEVISRIIARDLKAGIDTTVNKVWHGLIPTFDVCLCHKDISGIKYPAYGQRKYDGARVNICFDGNKVTAFSRSGKEFTLHGVLDSGGKSIMHTNEVFDGEILFTDQDGKILDRKTSNGLANKAGKGTITKEEAVNMIVIAWDIVDYTSTINYEDRFNSLISRGLTQDSGKIRIALTKEIQSEEEAYEFYDEQIAAGQEGAVLKNKKSKWVPKRSKDYGKMKAEEEADLLVTSWKEGTGKFAGRMGSLECKTSDGKLVVSVSGFKEHERNDPDSWIGKIITVKYNSVITSKNNEISSLFLPRYIETRFDKNVANTLEELK